MRLGRIDLIRYGHFTDRSFELPVSELDFHIVFGLNEAGKSTALSAIEDLLFGVPTRSPYGFLHDYPSMRIGALLENEDQSLEVVRRKGLKNTLLPVDNSALPGVEATLRRFLAGADRRFFERMFSLDHVRLERGGRELLKAEDDVGQMLFSAGAGIAGLRDRLAQLSDEADRLWAPRKAKHRKYYRAMEKLEDAARRLRQHTVSANKWYGLKRTFDGAREAHENIRDQFEHALGESTRLARIRRVYPYVRTKADLEGRVKDLGEVVVLPEDARQNLEESERNETETSARRERLLGLLEEACQQLEPLTYDEQLIMRADDVNHLHERRIEVRKGKEALQNRQVELDAAEADLRDLATEVDWQEPEIDDLIARIPAEAKVETVRSVLNRREGLISDVKNKTETLSDAETEFTELQERLEGMPPTVDVSRLAAVIRTVRRSGDSTDRANRILKEVNGSQACIDRILTSLNPRLSDEKDMVEMHVPTRTSVKAHREKVQNWEQRASETVGELARVEQELARDHEHLQSSMRDHDVVSFQTLQNARGERDALWSLVKRKHIQNVQIDSEDSLGHLAAPDDLASGFEHAMRTGDDLADRRFDHAEAAGRLEEISRSIGEHRGDLARVQKQRELLTKERECLDADWKCLWAMSQLEPLNPDVMLEWLEARDDLLNAIEIRSKAEGVLEVEQRWERGAKEDLLAELSLIGADCGEFKSNSIALVVEHADGVRRRRELKAERRAGLEEALQEAKNSVKRRCLQLDHAKEAWSQWRQDWSVAWGELGLATDSNQDVVSTQIKVIDQMRAKTIRVRGLRYERIGKINRDIASFEASVAMAVSEFAADLAGTSADDAVIEIEKRLATARNIRADQVRKTKNIEDIREEMAKLDEDRVRVGASVKHLRDKAGVGTNDELKIAIQKSDCLRTLQGELDKTLRMLEQHGDGLTADDLAAECAVVDIDDVHARQQTITGELETLGNQRSVAAENMAQARGEFEAVGGDDVAARAEARRQEALAEIGDVSERYVRVQTSVMLLQWAIDRYRREKQGPLLERAGELFAMITRGSFKELQVDYDGEDRAYILGLRPSGELVRLSGMSSGTADQLYLALRIAFVEDYLGRADALPFVADDLFINFDNDRAGAGFGVLGQLARKTQVLFFTHHSHLLDIARERWVTPFLLRI